MTNELKQRIHVKVVDKRVYIRMINMRKLKRICALTGVHLYHETSVDFQKGYYISSNQLDLFIMVMNDAGIDVVFIGKE